MVGGVRRRTPSALIYPAILVTMMLGLVGIIVIKVVPSFSEFYANFGRQLPLSTRIIIAISNGVTLEPLAAGAPRRAVAAAALVTWSQRPGHRQQIDKAILRIPWLGSAAQKFRHVAGRADARHAARRRHPAGPGARHRGEVAVEPLHGVRARRAAAARAGRPELCRGDAGARRLPDVAVKMIEVGESTGALQEMLNSLADFYDEEVETDVERFIKLIEPALLVVMGIVIAAVVLALYMPLFELSSLAGG